MFFSSPPEVEETPATDEMRVLLRKPIDELSSSKDIIRLCKKISIEYEGNNYHFQDLTEFLSFFSKFEEEPLEKYQPDEDHSTLNNYFLKYNEATISIFKTLNQKTVFIIVKQLKDHLKILFKDVNGSWNITIKIISKSEFVTIHHKKESCYEKTESGMNELFTFEWELKIFYSKYEFEKIEIGVVHIDDHEKSSIIKKAFKDIVLI